MSMCPSVNKTNLFIFNFAIVSICLYVITRGEIDEHIISEIIASITLFVPTLSLFLSIKKDEDKNEGKKKILSFLMMLSVIMFIFSIFVQFNYSIYNCGLFGCTPAPLLDCSFIDFKLINENIFSTYSFLIWLIFPFFYRVFLFFKLENKPISEEDSRKN